MDLTQASQAQRGALAKPRGSGPLSDHPTTFNRLELNAILGLYGLRVTQGEWRDYAIDTLADRAVFSVYRHAADRPLYQIVKDTKPARRQGAFAVVDQGGRILRRGQDLMQVLNFFERRRFSVIE